MTRFVSLSEFLWLAEQVTGIDADVLARSSRLNLADSALHAPRASFGGQDFCPDLIDKAAVPHASAEDHSASQRLGLVPVLRRWMTGFSAAAFRLCRGRLPVTSSREHRE